MTDRPTSAQTMTPQELEQLAVNRISQGMSRDGIMQALAQQGLSVSEASLVLSRAEQRAGVTTKVSAPPSPFLTPPPSSIPTATARNSVDSEGARHARNTMISGLVIMGIGVIITVGGYIAASSNPNGGHYYIFWGIVLVGLIRTIRGYSNLQQYR